MVVYIRYVLPYISLPSSSGMKNTCKSSKFHFVESCYNSKSAFFFVNYLTANRIFSPYFVTSSLACQSVPHFRRYLISVSIYEKLCLNSTVLLFSPKHLPQIFRIQWSSQRDIIIRHCGHLHFCTTLNKYGSTQPSHNSPI